MPKNNFNLEKLHEEFMRQQEFVAKRSAQTLRGYEASFKLLLTIMPNLYLEDLTPETMQKFFRQLQERKRIVGKDKVKVGVKNSTVGSYRSKFNTFFKWLISRGHLKQNPFEGIEYPNITYGDRRYISKKNIEKIIASVVSQPTIHPLKLKRDLLICCLLLYTGIRRGELLGLKLRDVNLDRGELFVYWETSKSRKDRVVPMNKKLVGIMKDYLDTRKNSTINYTTQYLLVSMNKDERLTEHGLKHWTEEFKARSGVDFHLHQFRHTFAVNLVNNGCDVAKLKQLMGHNDIRMTVKYLRCLPTHMMKNDVESLDIDNMLDYPN